ncbi:MAG: 4-hydroxybenzoate octaprenyltransferase [Phycisphaerales bacterium JB039]
MSTATASVDAAPAPPAPRSGLARLRLLGADIKLAHSVFALPFALLGAFMAGLAGEPAGLAAGKLGLVIVCMVSGRTWAMLINRLAEVRFDRENPRTARRAFASGRLRRRDGGLGAAAAAVVFGAGCAGFWLLDDNPWPVILGAPTLGWIALYSFTKRFTWLCHLFLGGALAASPLPAAIAVDPAWLSGAHAGGIWLLSATVALWVAGFDVIYALQDLEFDRARKLRSVPARFGAGGAMWVSRLLHAGAVACLAGVWGLDSRFGVIFGAGVAMVGGLLVWEHAIVARRGNLEMAFFTINGAVSLVLGALGIVDVLV